MKQASLRINVFFLWIEKLYCICIAYCIYIYWLALSSDLIKDAVLNILWVGSALRKTKVATDLKLEKRML